MNPYDVPRRQRGNRARDRYQARRAKAEGAMATPRDGAPKPRQPSRTPSSPQLPQPVQQALGAAGLWLRDAWWYTTHRPHVVRWLAIIGVVVFAVFALSRALSGRIYPNVWALGVPLDGLTVEEATRALVNAWNDEVRIEVRVEGEALASVPPVDLGLSIDAVAAAEAARAAGLSGLPFGHEVEVPIRLARTVAEDYLLALALRVNRLPYNAGFALQNGGVVGVPGSAGRELDIALTLDGLATRSDEIVSARRLDLLTLPIPPDFIDPQPLLAAAEQVVTQPFMLVGYDPFIDERITWATRPNVVVEWLEAGPGRLSVRQNSFREFISLLNESISEAGTNRYIDFDEALTQMERIIASGQSNAFLRLRHREQVYTVQRGDTGYRIARKHGVPFHLIQAANPGRNLDQLSPNDQINVPSADLVVPQMPVPEKRIIVDLDRQYLWAFENGQQVFEWPISSGMRNYPTYPGVFQILSHAEKAYGSSFTLCGSGNCGQWRMDWFMGIYEVGPEFMNGFHGDVLLPNGALLNGGSVGNPATFGCVMSTNANAKALYDWAELGTMVEIISSEYQPRSALARQVYNASRAAHPDGVRAA